MAEVSQLPHRPQHGRETVAAFTDTRDGGRALRVTWHHETAPHGPVVLLSMWRDDTCVATFRLREADVPALVEALQAGHAAAHDAC